MYHDHSHDTAPVPPHRRVDRLTCVGLGIAATVLGLLPWIVTGMRLPVQNLWADTAPPYRMPVALIPFSQYAVAAILGLVATAWAAAALAVRALHGRSPRGASFLVGVVILVLQAVATIQTVQVVRPGLTPRTASTVYLAACVAVVVVALLIGFLSYVLVTARARAAAVLGWALAAQAVGPWAGALANPLDNVPGETRIWLLTNVVRWVPAVIVGAAIAWGGLDTPGRILAAFVALVVLWIAPAALTAVTSSVGSRVLLPYPAELVDQTVRVFRAAATSRELVVPPLAVAVVVAIVVAVVGAVVGAVGRRLVRRS